MAKFSLHRVLIGAPLQTAEQEHQHVNKKIGLAVFASDALSSTAYATEEILIILSMATALTAAGVWAQNVEIFGQNIPILSLSIPISIAISILLAIVTISYRQTIHAYPNGGGAYIVARDNFGETVAQVAGAALLTDYVLTVAVSISSGVSQITSAFPVLLPYKVAMAIGIIVVITVVNLRGVKESGTVFSFPTYFFLGMMFFTLAVGFFRYATGSLGTVTDVEVFHHETVEPLALFLVLRAFSSGCTALTGIEAISNGIQAFKKPASHNAATTLVWMSSILITLFLGITFLANKIQAIPSHSETVISQLGRTVFGDGHPLYFVVTAGTALILLMAANTSYADFPRLAALQAGDGFLPRQLTLRGSRLVFSWGILVLAASASLLVIIANASVTALIPLYAVGVFLCFTISQAGMVVHQWRIGKMQREGILVPGGTVKGLEADIPYDPYWRQHMVISAIGAVCTFVVMLVFAITKFTSGAWFIVVLIPVLVFVFFQIHAHYKDVAKALSLKDNGVSPCLETSSVQTIILVDNVHAETYRMVNFALSSSGDQWSAVHVAINPARAEEVRRKWDANFPQYKDKLILLESPYRLLAEPIQEYILKLQQDNPGCFVHVIMGNLVMDTFWEQALHQNTALIFNLALGRMDKVAVTAVPYQIHRTNGGHHVVQEPKPPAAAAPEADPGSAAPASPATPA